MHTAYHTADRKSRKIELTFFHYPAALHFLAYTVIIAPKDGMIPVMILRRKGDKCHALYLHSSMQGLKTGGFAWRRI